MVKAKAKKKGRGLQEQRDYWKKHNVARDAVLMKQHNDMVSGIERIKQKMKSIWFQITGKK